MPSLALNNLLIDPAPQVLDGGLATELENLGEDLNHPLWSARILASAPDQVSKVHRSYYQAGARIATTATYQASIAGFLHGMRLVQRAQPRQVLLHVGWVKLRLLIVSFVVAGWRAS